MRIALTLPLLVLAASAQSFDVASLKPVAHPVGKDARGRILSEPTRLSAKNVSLLNLIVEAYHVQPFQVTGGPGWLDLDEFDLDARSAAPSTPDQMRLMLQTLLADRFHLALHRETRNLRVYALTLEKPSPNLHRATGELPPTTSPANFHGDMRHFANLISIGLSIPPTNDPTRPSIASGPPVPVIDRTGLEGNFDIGIDVPPELGADPYTRTQRALREQLGLKLESQRAPVEMLVIDRIDRKPEGN
jgi:uncharacterized protein (TIGR03435 family)